MSAPITESESLHILVLDDEESSRRAVTQCLVDTPHSVRAVGTPDEAFHLLEDELFDVAFFDLRLGPVSGLDLIPGAIAKAPWVKLVLMTAHASIETAVDAIRAGASDYLRKPFDPKDVRVLTEKLLAIRRKERAVAALREDAERAAAPRLLKSRDSQMRKVLEVARRAARSTATTMLSGESGTGKGMLARAMHEWSDRANCPFSVVSCPSLSEELLRSELFGHERGAFTGAVRAHRGRIETTEGGTLFLDEVADLPASIQPQLLRFLQDREYERVGGTETRTADVRVITATNQDIRRAMERDEFREDLFYRLNVIEIHLPALRDRPDDIIPLAETFLHRYKEENSRQLEGFTSEAEARLVDYPWPGNVRELENAVERAVILARGRRVGADLLPSIVPGSAPGATSSPLEELRTLDEVEKAHIQAVLDRTDSVENAASILGISTTTLWRRRKKHDL